MYITLEQLSTYLGLTESYIKEQLHLGNIKGVYDGNRWLFNKEQFALHKDRLEQKRKQLLKELELEEDWDAKDED
ncbi:excisionase family DNA-binding protein [Shouchella lehensis]|uniref:Helix-turn-helix domain-containing protein n=2 Tax=Shouchella lehensis TaxID=300825 RepID=A0A060M3I4_9BACI|nr:excisionase family DNA-binding protein [Shouchella lehensis]AIC95093.1 hypothetical protein BleG1_2526 [Shouchella lehensis G1]MBG9784081.1 hypothetical protein [Shouchella lehensis]RQW20916.1 hypothetical protein EH196_12675 [Bacillus sp. C1-1]TES50939.1 hypothetical protein E2L03_03190 [Shouchella lehensis]